MLDFATRYLMAGLSVVPIRDDGSKAPALPRGHPVLNRERPACSDELRRWFGTGTLGLAVLGGSISGNAECLDIETAEAAKQWIGLVLDADPDLGNRLVAVRTPRGGSHFWFRTEAAVPGSTKLAMDGPNTLIETRGEGGYAVAPPTNGRCSETGRGWVQDGPRPLERIATVTAEQRELMIGFARSLDRTPPTEPKVPKPVAASTELRPGDDFNARGPDWAAILEPHGWKCLRTNGAVRYWQRPGKAGTGISATTDAVTGQDGTALFHLFSSNADPLAPGAYSKFRLYAALNHRGALGDCARALAEAGYGSPIAPAPKAVSSPAGPVVPAQPKIGKRLARLPSPDESFTGAELMGMTLPAIRWTIPQLVAQGLTLLAGRPKVGKSWLALHWAVGAASGRTVLERYVPVRMPVLFLPLEDTRRRLQDRLRKTVSPGTDLSLLHIRTWWPWTSEGGCELLRQEVRRLGIRFVVIDTLNKIRAHTGKQESVYGADYAFAGEIKAVADELDVAILALHHTSKSPRTDPLEEVSGSFGLTGCADGVLVMKRDRRQNECVLHVTGRDLVEAELSLTADPGNASWVLHGPAAAHRVSSERDRVLALLRSHPHGLRPKEIAERLNRSPQSVRSLLWKMSDDGQVCQDDGKYIAVPESVGDDP